MTQDMHPELGKEVSIGTIDRELRKLWAEDDARTNASLINLAVYSEEQGSLESNSEAIRKLTRDHACRAILIAIDRDAPRTSIRAWITAHCHLSQGRKSVCCEQLAFALTGRATGRLRNTVFAHLNSDLPLILWWQGELSDNFEDRFYSLVDRFVFDSSDWADPVTSFGKITEAMNNVHNLIVQDLSWTRSFQFRVSFASLFDDPIALAALSEIETAEIHYHPSYKLTALMFVAWMAEQAPWKDKAVDFSSMLETTESQSRQVFHDRDRREIKLTMVSDPEATALSRLTLQAGEVNLSIVREKNSPHLTRKIRAPDYVLQSPGPIDLESPAELIGEQLSRGGKNSLYRKILPRFLGFLNR